MSAYLVDAARWSRTGDRVTHMRICEADTTTGKLIGNAEVVDINAVVNKLTRNAPVFVDVPFPGNGPQLREQAYGNLDGVALDESKQLHFWQSHPDYTLKQLPNC